MVPQISVPWLELTFVTLTLVATRRWDLLQLLLSWYNFYYRPVSFITEILYMDKNSEDLAELRSIILF